MRRRDLFGHAAAAGLARERADEEKVWDGYVAWYRAQPITVSDPLRAYLDHLERSGADAAGVERQGEILERLIRERRDQLHPFFFDRTYAGAAPRFNTEPNRLLVETVRELRPGRALDIHMGQGRNAVYLATLGWDVTGFDFSAGGVRAAREAAAKAGVRLTTQVCRHEDFDFGRERWRLVVMSYAWVPLRGQYPGRIAASLAPGGLLVFEHLMEVSGGERAAPWLPRPGELPELFGGLRIVRYEDTRAPADWSWRPERIARLVARK